MKHWFEQLRKKVGDIRERESAQRDFVRAIYSTPNRLATNYEKPAYLRRARIAA
jgi:hypothetical protein